MSRTIWLMSAGIFALAAAPAYAQDNTQPTGETSPLQESAEVDATTDVSPTDSVEEGDIVITAQGRTQILQDVPLAVSAVSGESLQNTGATDIRQLNQLAPSLLVSSTGTEANGSARIRGIGTVGDNPGLESSVAVFIDGVYRSRSGIGLNELGEIERVEVLRGPQGTLFGRNASAGLIHVISKKPNLNEMEGFVEASYGNYDFMRLAGGITGPIGEGIGYRLDGVWAQRDGFYRDLTNNTRVNDRDRYFVRGQLLFEPNSDISVRLIGDYTKRDEACCAAVYIDESVAQANRNLLTNLNPIIPVLLSLGTPPAAFTQDPFSRNIFPTPGRTYGGGTTDWGVSGQVDWSFGNATLTSITAYRNYDTEQASDTDYNFADILYRADDGNAYNRRFKTFSQELRLQGQAFNDHLDWLIGAYYAHEKLRLTDNLKFGTQYGAFASCRLLATINPGIPRNPAQAGCRAGPGGVITDTVLRGIFPDPDGPGPIQGAQPFINGLIALSGVNNVGSNNDVYSQTSENYAFFTHNIFHITDELALTVGLRYTNENKDFQAAFGNNNTSCPAIQAALLPFLTPGSGATTTVPASLTGGVISLACQGNSTAELNGVTITDDRSEDEWTGTGVLSYQPNPDLLLYASYSRGYKAGGFNLDRSALKGPILPFAATPGGAQALVGNLQFDPEIVDAFEIGMKLTGRRATLNVAIFHQKFENFQLNTFNGSVFLVQNINGCSDDLGETDRDTSAATGACVADNVIPGVTSEGIEIEASVNPVRDLRITGGFTYANTSYNDDLVGNDSGVPLDPALRLLPGDNISNAPESVFTGSIAYTPQIGNSGMSALFYVDTRITSDYNTGSDLFPQKEQDGFALVNARFGVRGPEERWSLEVWAQNLFDQNYTQVAFNTPFQADGAGPPGVFPAAQYPGGTQIFSAFLAEPRTYGITGRFRF
jgi:iron complex outermembrane recepter protein